MKRAGAVMAGGHSRRMGFDKALLPCNGLALWQRQSQLLSTLGADPVAVVRRPDQTALGTVCWRDRRCGLGPLAGLEAALLGATDAGTDAIVLLAVDMPWLEADWFHWLSAARPNGAVGRHEGRFEPLAAVYPLSALPVVQAHLEAGRLSLQALLEALVRQGVMAALEVPSAFLPQIRSLNTVDAWPSITARSGSPPREPGSTK